MTAPRQVLPGAVYLVTRRCSEQRRFLRPSALTNEIFQFVLALAARRYGVRIHAVCVLSNHYHLLVSDPRAKLPAFVQYLDGLVARAINATLGRWEGFWSSGRSFSAVANASATDIVRKAAYVLANPVAAGLVAFGRDWPGLRTAVEHLGRAVFTARRPDVFFRKKGGLPDSVELEITVPPGFASAEDFRAAVAAEVRRLEEEARRDHSSKGQRFLGAARVLAEDPRGHGGRVEPRRRLNPRVAAIDPETRIAALAGLVRFLREYRTALTALRAGVRDVVFPAGTYRLRVELGVTCAALG